MGGSLAPLRAVGYPQARPAFTTASTTRTISGDLCNVDLTSLIDRFGDGLDNLHVLQTFTEAGLREYPAGRPDGGNEIGFHAPALFQFWRNRNHRLRRITQLRSSYHIF